MGTYDKFFRSIMSGQNDKNISFNDFRKFILSLGFNERIKGDHFIYSKEGIEEILNIQPNGNKAKPYQVKQVRNIVLKYKIGGNKNA
ncbi:MAG TPA: toxin HicA [Lachnospiraceae bacterium]|nr:toxin HicA [Lachnospiraceae bacterium]HCA69334.1 toxin HicA [Lachnospiraceae bacterium]HCM12759.1 toxin HicA [Lachnospiraceae bacterium]HCR39389.1 toxin HicA [Lachnospiraceae bacterium]